MYHDRLVGGLEWCAIHIRSAVSPTWYCFRGVSIVGPSSGRSARAIQKRVKVNPIKDDTKANLSHYQGLCFHESLNFETGNGRNGVCGSPKILYLALKRPLERLFDIIFSWRPKSLQHGLKTLIADNAQLMGSPTGILEPFLFLLKIGKLANSQKCRIKCTQSCRRAFKKVPYKDHPTSFDWSLKQTIRQHLLHSLEPAN